MAHNRTGFFAVKFGERWFDVACHDGSTLLASSHDGGDVPWDALSQGLGIWTNASPFPVAAERPAEKPTTPPDEKKKKPANATSAAVNSERVQEALDLVDSIVSGCDDIPEEGADFASSVAERASSIGETIEQRQHVTDKQFSALENMLSGVERWLERRH